MKRTFGTPLKVSHTANKPCFRNKILDVVDFGEACPFSPIEFTTPKRTEQGSGTSSSLASISISPVTKATSSDEEVSGLLFLYLKIGKICKRPTW